ncbi:MAG TPA: hypothetical protein VMZ22_05235 [Acidimicrobiales bacterium]|nr:hypothetical protein [Acidimicrobiales bacterium]
MPADVAFCGRDDVEATTCAYSPGQLVLKLPLRVGATWHADARCEYGEGEADHTVADAQVTATSDDKIGGRTVRTFVVKAKETYTETYPPDEEDPEDTGSFTTRLERTFHVDPATLMIVIEEQKSTDDDASITMRRVLRSLTPA